jgi:hypothetical protein
LANIAEALGTGLDIRLIVLDAEPVRLAKAPGQIVKNSSEAPSI